MISISDFATIKNSDNKCISTLQNRYLSGRVIKNVSSKKVAVTMTGAADLGTVPCLQVFKLIFIKRQNMPFLKHLA